MRIVYDGKVRYIIKSFKIANAIRNSLEHPVQVWLENNAGRTGVQVRVVEESGPRRIFLWDDGREYFGPAPGTSSYGPDGVDTNC